MDGHVKWMAITQTPGAMDNAPSGYLTAFGNGQGCAAVNWTTGSNVQAATYWSPAT
jgi:hypothetical protein